MVKDKVGVYATSTYVQYLGVNGELVTELFTDYTRQNLITKYPTIETFLTAWFNAERKEPIVAELLEQGEAVLVKSELWEYLTVTAGKVIVEARDLAGNTARKEI
jgi:type I site-specific restriction endonuclease